MIIKETLKSLCCNNGWCYGIFWGFDQRKTLLLTLKDAYYEEQMGALIDIMLMQIHVLGGGVIGQVAFSQNHQWMYSDTHHQRQNYLPPFENLEVFQDDSEFYSQFCTGIKTIALISVEPWGVVQFGSTHKKPETRDFADQVKELFREVKFLKGDQILDSNSTTQFSSLLSCGISNSSVLPSQSFPSTSNHPVQIGTQSTNQFEDYLLESGNINLFDCSTTQALRNSTNYSVLTSGLNQNMSADYADILNTQNFASLINQTDYKAQRPSGLLTMEELFQESDFTKSISNPGLDEDDFSRWLSPQPGPNSSPASFTTLLNTDLSHSTRPVPLSNLSGNNSPIRMSENLPTNSIQSSLTDAFRLSNPDKLFNTWNQTLIPVKTRTPNSLFFQLGLDQLLDGGGITGTTSCSLAKSGFEDKSSPAAKRRKTDGFSSSEYNQVKNEGIFTFDGKMKSSNPVFDTKTRNIGVHSESSAREAGSCIGDNCIMDACNTSSSERQDEPVITAKKLKAKAGTKPRPKDRQMIQDRLAELRELIPSGEKMSIDRLLERTIRHLNFMQSLIKHVESLKQIDKPKSCKVPKNHSSKDSGGVTWACEVGSQSMVCPLIVEDLYTPGQMLIEILCEEQFFFLEIADIIRGFGLTILKGVIGVREPKKIWAHFLVQAEGTRRVTRHEIFSSLIHLLQLSGQSAAANASDGFGNGISSSSPSFNNCQHAAVSFPVNLSDALQCSNL